MPKRRYAADDYYDLWLPELSPSASLLSSYGPPASPTAREWTAFARRYRSEMRRPEAQRLIALLAALSHQANFSIGCYCEDERRCHRSVLRELFAEHGAHIAG